MKIIWLGQAGLYFETDNGLKIMVDPYLSDSCAKRKKTSCRRTPLDERFLEIKPDVMVFTHNHIDHYDPETVAHFITSESSITVLSPFSVWDDVRKIGGNNNYVLFDTNTEWTENDVYFKAVKAFHSDPYAVGVIIKIGQRCFYITGDTLYNSGIFDCIKEKVDVLFLPINGRGNNMNSVDAGRFAEKISPDIAVPMHFGMLDDLDPGIFHYPKSVIPEAYKDLSEKLFEKK